MRNIFLPLYSSSISSEFIVFILKYLGNNSMPQALLLFVIFLVSNSRPALFWPYGLYPARLCPWDFSRQESWRDCHFLLQGNVRNSREPRNQTCISCICRQILYCWATRGAHKLGNYISDRFFRICERTHVYTIAIWWCGDKCMRKKGSNLVLNGFGLWKIMRLEWQ